MTGISTPILGISWVPGVSDEDQARALMAFMEDRRVLYAPHELEDVRDCTHSVDRIRSFLTEMLAEGGLGDAFVDRLQKMRAAARRFMGQVHPDRPDPDESWIPRTGLLRGGPRLYQALGELRGVFGVHLAEVADAYGIQVTGPLTSILQLAEDDPD